MRDQIFISYRHDDARGASGRLYDWLRIAFGRDRVFRDVSSIGVGNWRAKINEALARSAVFVAVIGPRWADAENLPRLRDKADLVRYELTRALADADLTIVPTLVEGAAVPKPGILPAALQPIFAKWNARRVSEDGWESDTRRLVSEIEDATGLPIDPNLDLLLTFPGATQQRMAELPLQAGQIDALRQTMDELTRKLAEADAVERPARAAAVDALASGDSIAAETLFETECKAQSTTAKDARLRMAEAARNVANLALLHDVTKAVRFYRKALNAAPKHGETARLLGYALMLAGDLTQAEAAMVHAIEASVAQRNAWGEMAARVGLGDVLVAHGDGPGALAAFRESFAIAEAFETPDPADTKWQREFSVILSRMADVLMAQGEWTEGVAAFNMSLAIRRTLATRDPANTEWQRDLSISLTTMGNFLADQEDWTEALDAYTESLAIAEALAQRDSAKALWQRDILIQQHGIGDALAAQGDEPGALDAYRKSLIIAEALATRDAANTERRRDLSISLGRIGDVLAKQGDVPGALDAYRKELAIAEALAAHDPANRKWQRDLSVSLSRIGNMLVAQGDSAGGLAMYKNSLAIDESLAAHDPGNVRAQYDVAVLCGKIGTIGRGQTVKQRRQVLLRGRDILLSLQSAGKLRPFEGIAFFDRELAKLG